MAPWSHLASANNVWQQQQPLSVMFAAKELGLSGLFCRGHLIAPRGGGRRTAEVTMAGADMRRQVRRRASPTKDDGAECSRTHLDIVANTRIVLFRAMAKSITISWLGERKRTVIPAKLTSFAFFD